MARMPATAASETTATPPTQGKRGPTAATLDKEARRKALMAKAEGLKKQQLKPSALTAAFISLRNRRRDLKAEDEDLSMQQAAIENVIRYRMEELGQDTFTAIGHTVYQSKLTQPKVEDRAKFIAWMIEEDLIDEMDVRPTVDTLKRWQEEHTPLPTKKQIKNNETPPPPPVPGVTLSTYIALRVRKAG